MRLEELARTFLLWPTNLFRDGPKRIGRLFGLLSNHPRNRNPGTWAEWLHRLLIYKLDIFGVPELLQFIIRVFTRTRRLNEIEIQSASDVIGPNNLRFNEVRVAKGGLSRLVFKYNRQRAFCTWHTINIPEKSENNIPLVVHELVHTFQYEQRGSIYISQGIWAQLRNGQKAYDYGGNKGLIEDYDAGKQFSEYNREQQGQIAQDYCALQLNNQNVAPYAPYIRELRAREI